MVGTLRSGLYLGKAKVWDHCRLIIERTGVMDRPYRLDGGHECLTHNNELVHFWNSFVSWYLALPPDFSESLPAFQPVVQHAIQSAVPRLPSSIRGRGPQGLVLNSPGTW
jgi:hypothetical protein